MMVFKSLDKVECPYNSKYWVKYHWQGVIWKLTLWIFIWLKKISIIEKILRVSWEYFVSTLIVSWECPETILVVYWEYTDGIHRACWEYNESKATVMAVRRVLAICRPHKSEIGWDQAIGQNVKVHQNSVWQ